MAFLIKVAILHSNLTITIKRLFLKPLLLLKTFYMKKTFLAVFCLITLLVFVAWSTNQTKVSDQLLEAGFVHPPDSIQTSVYWYWISDNISKALPATLRLRTYLGSNN